MRWLFGSSVVILIAVIAWCTRDEPIIVGVDANDVKHAVPAQTAAEIDGGQSPR